MASRKILFPTIPYPIQNDFAKAFCDNYKRNGVLLVQSPTGTGKTTTILSALGHIVKNQTDLLKKRSLKLKDNDRTLEHPNCKLWLDSKRSIKDDGPLKIYYISRTHKQLNQVLEEIKFSPYRNYFTFSKYSPKTVLCKNICNLKFDEGKDDNDVCYFQMNYGLYAKESGIEGLDTKNLKNGICPFLLNQQKIEKSNLILITYAAFKQIFLKRPLTNNIIVFDEAHNFMNMLNDQEISIIKFEYINALKSILDENIREEIRVDMKKNHFFILCMNIINYTKNMTNSTEVTFKQILRDLKYKPEDFKIISRSYYEFSDLLALILTDLQLLGRVNAQQKLILSEKMKRMYDFFSTIFFSQKGYIHIIRDDESFIIGYYYPELLTPVKKMIEMSSTICFMSGTLYPCKPLQYEVLKETKKVVTYETYDHIIKPEDIFPVILSRSLYDTKFRFSFTTKYDLNTIYQLGLTIKMLCRHIPDGILIFFSSYKYMDYVMQVWKTSKIYKNIEADKKIFVGLGKLQVFSDYENHILSKKGGIFTAVYRGIFSEGVNFPGPLSRAVFIVGMPYPYLYDLKSYLRFRKAERIMLPEDYTKLYLNECMLLINQSIGRTIRSAKDYSSIFLIDDRFHFNEVKENLSTWIKNNIKGLDDYETIVEELDNFFDFHETKNRLKNNVQKILRTTKIETFTKDNLADIFY